VRLHVLLEQNRALDETSLLEAVRAGHCFIGFDFLGDTSGFAFEAENASGRKIQGDEIQVTGETRLRVRSPVAGRIVIFKDGAIFSDDNGVSGKELTVTERGVYRAEVYLPFVDRQSWIISNPIYAR
jgi:hypothetical protein